MVLFYTGFAFVIGAVLGSFYNVVGLRVPKKESIVYPGSHCTACGHELAWYELIPVLSFFALRGKCRSCNGKVSIIYPVMELITAMLFAFAVWHFGLTMELAVAIVFISLLMIITVSDLAYMLIPDRILLPFGLLLAVLRIAEPLTPWWDAWLGALLGFALLLLIAIVSKGGMGGGDIKLYAVVGLVLGVQLTLLSFFLACLIGAVAGVGAKVAGKVKKKEPIPFGPFIVAGSLIAYFYGNEMIQIYWQWMTM